MNNKAYETKPAVPAQVAVKPATVEAPKMAIVKNECPLCHEQEKIIRHELGGGVILIHCQRIGCGYNAKYKDGKLA
jgi:hypothetical protein